jgi:hypothetical protein
MRYRMLAVIRLRNALTASTVSQFTLFATTKKGNKPDFHASASGEKAKSLYDHFYKQIQTLHGEDKVKNGQFAAMMDVALVNDGPVSPRCSHGGISTEHCDRSLYRLTTPRPRWRSQ